MNVLLLSYHFPPMGGAGVQRALKFSKYLGDFGVHTTVLSGSDPGYLQDPALASEIPGDVPVVRVPHQPLLQRALAWRARGRAGPVAGGPAAASWTGRSPSPEPIRRSSSTCHS